MSDSCCIQKNPGFNSEESLSVCGVRRLEEVQLNQFCRDPAAKEVIRDFFRWVERRAKSPRDAIEPLKNLRRDMPNRLQIKRYLVVASPWASRIFNEASLMDFMMLTYPVHLHRFPSIPFLISSSLGVGFCWSKYRADISMPGVQ